MAAVFALARPNGCPSSTWNDAQARAFLAANTPRIVSPNVQADGTFNVVTTSALSAGEQTTLVSSFAAFTPAADPAVNRDAIDAGIANALPRLRQIQNQATAFASQAPYVAANLTNLNDLLAKSQSIAVALGDIATDLIQLARKLSNQFDATN